MNKVKRSDNTSNTKVWKKGTLFITIHYIFISIGFIIFIVSLTILPLNNVDRIIFSFLGLLLMIGNIILILLFKSKISK
jgi:hypothetical protein